MNINLRNIPTTCIYSFYTAGLDEATYYSTNALVEIAKHIEDLRKGLHPIPELNDAFKANSLGFQVLMEFPDSVEQCIVRAHYGRRVEKVVDRGNKDLRSNFKAGVFRLKLEVKVDYRNEEGGEHPAPLLYVLAVSNRNDKYVMAIFKSRPEADVWVKNNIDKPDNLIPVFHKGELTAGYHKRYALKLR